MALRYEEEGDTWCPGRRVGKPSEHAVHNIVGEVVLAARNEYLGPSDGIGTALRLCQAHGACHLARDQRRQPALFELVRRMGVDGVDGSL
eukprot:scaffold33986_cov35-Tisochrysis_lutea.AAC.1